MAFYCLGQPDRRRLEFHLEFQKECDLAFDSFQILSMDQYLHLGQLLRLIGFCVLDLDACLSIRFALHHEFDSDSNLASVVGSFSQLSHTMNNRSLQLHQFCSALGQDVHGMMHHHDAPSQSAMFSPSSLLYRS